MAVLYTNNAASTLASSISNVGTSLSVASGQGALFPSLAGGGYFYATLANTAGSVEIVKVTARTADTMTIVRGQDGTSALAWSAGDKVELRITKAMLDDLKTDTLAALSSSNVTTALGYTPYNATNPSGYISANQTITVSGDASGSGSTSIALTLASSGVTAGTYNSSATAVTPITVDAKGRVTGTGAAVTITPAWSSITSKPTTLSGFGITDGQPLDADLTAIAALTGTSGFLKTNGAGTWSVDTATYLTTSTASSTYAPLASPTFTGTPAAPTAAVDTNTTQVATTAYVIGQGYLKSATAASTYQTQSGMSSYLTTASAASTYLPLGGGTITGNLDFGGTSRRITGDFSNATTANRVLVQTSTANSNTFFGLIPNGTAVNAQFQVYNSSDPANSSLGTFTAASGTIRLVSGFTGTGSTLPLVVVFGSAEAVRFATSGNVLIGTTTDNATDKLQVNGSVSATSFTGAGTGLTGTASSLSIGGNAATVGGLSASSFMRVDSANSGDSKNANFAVGQAASRNFIQSHNSQPLDLNPLGNAVTINGNTPLTSGNYTSYVNSGTHDHSRIAWVGSRTAESGTTNSTASGYMEMVGAYNNGWPTTYGNVLSMNGGGASQLFMGWNGGSGVETGELYYRSMTDWRTNWGSWRRVLTNANWSEYAAPISHTHDYVLKTGDTMSGTLTSSNGAPFSFTAVGSGTYNIGAFYLNTGGMSLEAPMTTDSISGTKVPLILTWRGGYPSVGGLKLTGGANGELGGNTILHAGNYTSYNGHLRALGAADGMDFNTTSYNSMYYGYIEGSANKPTAYGYSYGTILTFDPGLGSGGRAQFYISHAGNDLTFRGGWSGNDSWQTWNRVLTNQNYTSYSPSLTGSGASGTWGINVTGSAGSTTGNAGTATILKSVNTTATGASTWNPQGLTYQAWGQYFTNSNISADSGDLTLWLRASQYAGGGTELCMIIDGDYYAGTGAYKVLHAGNYNSYAPTLTGTGASGTWGINVTGTANNITAYTINQNLGTGNQVTFDSIILNNNGNGANVRVGDDAWLGDINIANTIRLSGAQNAANGYIVFGNSDTTALGRAGTGALTYGGNTILHAGNVSSYAAASAANGAMILNSQTISADYTLTGQNAMSAGPITINTGVTVTIATGANWSVV